MKWYLKAMKSYMDFKGRATRSEYWYFAMYYTLGLVLPLLKEST